jgi:hypothetical protein
MKPPDEAVARCPECQRDSPLSGKSGSCAPADPARPTLNSLISQRLSANSRLAIRMLNRGQGRCGAESFSGGR